MSYQPIQMGEFQAPGFSDAIIAARQMDRQKEQDRWAQLRDQGAMDAQKQVVAHQQFEDQRQNQADLDAKHAEIQRLYDAGLGHQAEQFAQMHGFTFAQQPNTGKAPTAPQMPQAPVEPEQGPILPQSQPSQYQGGGLDHFDAGAASQNLGGIADPAAIEHMRQMQAERDAAAAYPGKLDEYGRQMTEVFPQQQAAYEKEKATYDQRAANPVVNFTGNGTSFSVDPLEARQAQIAQNERRAQQFREAFAAEPDMAAHAGDFSVRAGLGEPTGQIFGDFRAQMSAEAKAKADAEKQDWERTHKGEISPAALEQKKELARIAAAASGTNRTEPNNERLFSLLDRRANNLRATTQFTKLVAGDKTVRGMMANIADGTVPLQHRDAQIQLARYFRQAQPTEGEMHLLYSQLGGTMDKWNQFVARVSNGDLSTEQLRQVKIAAGAVTREDAEDKRRFVETARKFLGPRSGLDMMPDQAQNLFEGLAAELGLDPASLPPLYQTEGGVTLGSGKKPTVHQRSKEQVSPAHEGGESDNDFLRRMGIR
jgi:hypothetical protein